MSDDGIEMRGNKAFIEFNESTARNVIWRWLKEAHDDGVITTVQYDELIKRIVLAVADETLIKLEGVEHAASDVFTRWAWLGRSVEELKMVVARKGKLGRGLTVPGVPASRSAELIGAILGVIIDQSQERRDEAKAKGQNPIVKVVSEDG